MVLIVKRKYGIVIAMSSSFYHRMFWAGTALLCIIVIGTAGYWLIGGNRYSVIDSLYMTVITITTIGFTEVIDLSNSPGGRVFTMFVAVAGIGVMAYAVTNLTAVVVEGQLTMSLKRRHMENLARKTRGHYIICGLSSFGQHIINEMRATKRATVIIDNDRGKIEKAIESFRDDVFIEGDATGDEVLKKAGIFKATGLFAVTGDDNQNLVISITAKQINPSIRVVVECINVNNEEKMKKAGADAVISPSYIGGLRMASEMVRPAVVSFLDIMMRDRDKNLRIEEIPVGERHTAKTISTLGIKNYSHSLLLAVRTGTGWTYNPPEQHVVKSGDILVFMTTPEGRTILENFLI